MTEPRTCPCGKPIYYGLACSNECADAWDAGYRDGMAGLATGLTYGNDPYDPRSIAYDRGRNYADQLTERGTA